MDDIVVTKKEPLRKVHQIKVDRAACIGAGTCVVISPAGFELDAENIAVVKQGATTLSDDELMMAAQSCPTQAIILIDSAGKQILP